MGKFFRNHSNDPIESRRTIKDRMWMYFGRYDGPVEIPDRASAGYEWIDLSSLQKEFQTNPDQFTDGLRVFVEAYGSDMKDFIGTYCSGASETMWENQSFAFMRC